MEYWFVLPGAVVMNVLHSFVNVDHLPPVFKIDKIYLITVLVPSNYEGTQPQWY